MTQFQPNSTCAEEYTVKRGDSFYLIAHKLGVPLRDLLAANRDIHPARLTVGDVLCIPREEDDTPTTLPVFPNESIQPATPPESIAPTVPAGDGIMTTEEPLMPSPSEAIRCPVDNQYVVQNGQSVADIQLANLISRNTLKAANPNINLESVQEGQTICVPTENIPCSLPGTYTLTTYDNLETVATQFNLPIGSLLRANPCLAPQDFEAGVTVILPT